MRVCILGSGSSGNAIYVSSGATQVLVDAGFSARELTRRLTLVGVDPHAIEAILVTHEHQDHVRGLGPFARRVGASVFLTAGTLGALAQSRASLDGVANIVTIERSAAFRVGDLAIEAFPVPHDVADPVQYVLGDGGSTVAIALDLGYPSQLVRERLRGAHLVVLEANYDEVLLLGGHYPPEVKQRVRSRTGHLSNRDAAELVADLAADGVRRVVLGHLSADNNAPLLAVGACIAALKARGVTGVDVVSAMQNRPTAMFVLET